MKTNKTPMEYLINLTPHAINFYDDNDNLYFTIEPSGTVARLGTNTVVSGNYDEGTGISIPITETKFSKIENLPEDDYKHCYIVSSLVAQACRGRRDIFIPNESIRDENGRIIGCRSLGRI